MLFISESHEIVFKCYNPTYDALPYKSAVKYKLNMAQLCKILTTATIAICRDTNAFDIWFALVFASPYLMAMPLSECLI